LASVSFALNPEDGVTVDVDVTAVTSTAGDRIEVGVRRCVDGTCDYPQYYAGALPRGAVTIDASAAVAKLRTVVGGVELSATWAPGPAGTVVVSGSHGGGTDGDLAFEAYRVDPATTHLVLDDVGCNGAGQVGDEVRVESAEGSLGDAVPLRRLRLPRTPPVCKG
jgi:hypothetical protein